MGACSSYKEVPLVKQLTPCFLSATHTFSLQYPGGCQTRGGGNAEVLGDLRDRAAAGEATGGEGEEAGAREPAQTNRGGKVSIHTLIHHLRMRVMEPCLMLKPLFAS